MSRTISPEVALAVALIKRTVMDLKVGSERHKEEAWMDIEHGCLEYWTEVVDSEFGCGDDIRRELQNLVS